MTISRGGLRYTYRLRQYAAKDGKRQLQLFITVAGREIELGTPIRLFPNDWDKKNKRVRDTEPFAAEYRDWMHAAEKRLGVVAKYYFGREAELTREVLAQAISGKQAVEGGTLAEAMEAHRMIKARSVTAGSMVVFNSSLKSVKGSRIGRLQVKNIQKADVEQYIREQQDKRIQNITIQNYLANIKTILRERKKRGLLEYNAEAFDVKLKQKELYTIALTPVEVDVFRAIPAMKGEEISKEVFLIGCFTGMRISDILALRVSDVHLEDGVIVRNQKKTGGTVTIPILPVVDEILTVRVAGRNANDRIFDISCSSVQRKIKQLAERGGMDRPVLTGKVIGSSVQEQYRPLYEVIATHAARRTFVTIAQSLGFDPLFIMKITGHKNLKTFQRYYRITMTDRVLAEYKDRWGGIAGKGPTIENPPGTAGGEVVRCEIRTVLRLRASGMPDAVVLREVAGRRQYYGLWVGQQVTGMEGADYAAIEMGEVVPTDADAAVREAVKAGGAMPFCLAEEVVLKEVA